MRCALNLPPVFAAILVAGTADAQSAQTISFGLAPPSAPAFVLRIVGNAEQQRAIGAIHSPVALSGCGGPARAPWRKLNDAVARRRLTFWSVVRAAECRSGLPTGLLDSVVLAESGYDPTVVSGAGAVGLAQLMPATATQLGVANTLDPAANVDGGARYLRSLLVQYRGDVPTALAAYNAGPNSVRRARGIPFNGETPGYVERVLGYWRASGVGPLTGPVPARALAELLGFLPSARN